MKLTTLKFVAPVGSPPEPWEWKWEQSVDFSQLKESPLPKVLLLTSDSLPELRKFPAGFLDRGLKNKGKELSKYLLGHDDPRIPIIDGGFSSKAQVERSIRAFLAQALKKDERKTYIIGIDSLIFRQLQAALRSEPSLLTPKESIRIEKGALSNTHEIPAKLLVQLREKITDLEWHAVNYIGQSNEAQLVRLLIAHAAKNTLPVLILGDTGTGKELVAREIHNRSEKASGKFIAVNCGAIPSELFESELFGHKKGAFTHATQNKEGLWNKAGTLFLDEIADLDVRHQVKILRTLEEHAIRPVGGIDSVAVSARIIAATNRDLFSLVQAGKFREDLYYRLRGFLIRTYPLRQHPEDIPRLADYLWKKMTGNPNNQLPQELTEDLMSYDWPGNVREMKLILGNLYTFFGQDHLTAEDLKAVFYLEGQTTATRSSVSAENEALMHAAECLRHMKRASEVVHATMFLLRPLVEAEKPSAETLKTVKNNLSFRVGELDLLCVNPSLFFSEPTFFAVWRLLGHLAYFQDYLSTNVPQARKYWGEELKQQFESTLSAILKGIDEIKQAF